MKRILLTQLCALFFTLGIYAQVKPSVLSAKSCDTVFGNNDKKNFIQPGKMYYPETWFHFIGGNVSKEGITADLEAIAGAGTSGITLFHGQFGGVWPGVKTQITCLSPLWEDAVQHTALECRRLGLKFSMENCPGWAMAGGPWIKPAEAMRQLVWSRTDAHGGKKKIKLQLPMPQPAGEPWRDYQAIAVLAFPRPEGDTRDTLKPLSVKSEGNLWDSLLSGKSTGPVSLSPSTATHPNSFEISFANPVVIRSIQLPSINSLNPAWAYEPAVSIKIEALGGDYKYREILQRALPQSNWQDDIPLTLSCTKDIPSKKFRISFVNKHSVSLAFCRFSSAARENNWEMEAARVLRSVGKSDEKYNQDRKAYIDPAQILDISTFVNDKGELNWDAPAGEWTILRMGHVNAGKKNGPAPPEGTGWECDKLSQQGADAQFAGYIGRLSGSSGILNGGLLTGMTMDSWECGSQTWTSNMEDEFQQREGYPLRKWMPALLGYVLKDQETTFRFLHDWKSAINEMFTNNFYGRMSLLAKQNGLSVTYETAAGDVFPADIMEYYKFADMPMCEFWQPMADNFVGSLNFKPIKPCVSAARIYGKPRIGAEAFTSFNLTWDEQWQMLKETANVNMVEGVTHVVYHTYTHNPQVNFLPPGTSFGAGIGTPFVRGETWWKHMPFLNIYLARCSYLLESGVPVSDVLWYLGDEIDHKPDQNAPFPAGFKYDYCNPDGLLNKIAVVNGKLTTPGGISYKILWLPKTTHMLPETLEKIRSLIHEGAVVIGDPPKQLATLSGDKNAQGRFNAAVKSIWSDEKIKGRRKVGKGTVISGLSLQAAINELGLKPDVSGDTALWLHRKVQGADWYFIVSPKGKAFKGSLSFSAGGNAELWDPVNGEIKEIASEEKDGRSSVFLDLPQAGSCFVVFRHSGKTSSPLKTKIISEIKIGSNWTLNFPKDWGAPGSINLEELKQWKDLDIAAEGKAFSGTATYTTTFDVENPSSGNSYLLNLGKVTMIAKVYVNGKDIGTVWANPYRLDISSALIPDRNTLKVEVTSTWFNRLVYDAGLPEDKRKTWTISGPSKDNELRASGLLGPVTIVAEKQY